MRTIPMETVIEYSFLDFHVKGFSYLCLKRSDEETIKLYFFDGDVSQLPEVVAPHDHRYNFDTLCLSGEVENRWYAPSTTHPTSRVYQQFEYLTPLLGGAGFKWIGETELALLGQRVVTAGQFYKMNTMEIHTIVIRAPGTILQLYQYEDKVPVGVPTHTFTQNREPPSLSGLYNKPKPDDVRRLMGYVAATNLPRIV